MFFFFPHQERVSARPASRGQQSACMRGDAVRQLPPAAARICWQCLQLDLCWNSHLWLCQGERRSKEMTQPGLWFLFGHGFCFQSQPFPPCVLCVPSPSHGWVVYRQLGTGVHETSLYSMLFLSQIYASQKPESQSKMICANKVILTTLLDQFLH